MPQPVSCHSYLVLQLHLIISSPKLVIIIYTWCLEWSTFINSTLHYFFLLASNYFLLKVYPSLIPSAMFCWWQTLWVFLKNIFISSLLWNRLAGYRNLDWSFCSTLYILYSPFTLSISFYLCSALCILINLIRSNSHTLIFTRSVPNFLLSLTLIFLISESSIWPFFIQLVPFNNVTIPNFISLTFWMCYF